MPQSLSRILVHLAFSTKDRVSAIGPDVQEPLYCYMGATLNNIDCQSIKIGGMEDHVHLFFGLSRTKTIAEVTEAVKTSSSKWIKTQTHSADLRGFHWQRGYGAFSVSQSGAARVIDYIVDQARHHRRLSFQEEYRQFLHRHGIEFDERYVWD